MSGEQQRLIDDSLRLRAIDNFLSEIRDTFRNSIKYDYYKTRFYPSLDVVGFEMNLGWNSFNVDFENLDSVLNATIRFRTWIQEEDKRLRRIG